MTAREFVQKICSYYGGLQYPEGQREDLQEYLRSKSPDRLDALYKATIRAHSTRWKTLPDIATFESKEVAAEAERILEIRFIEDSAERRKRESETMIEERVASREEVEAFLAEWGQKMRDKAKEL